jgi:hypothetical protein
MVNNIVKWLSDNGKWMNHMGQGARGVDQLGLGTRSGSAQSGAHGADRLS